MCLHDHITVLIANSVITCDVRNYRRLKKILNKIPNFTKYKKNLSKIDREFQVFQVFKE